MLGDAKIRLLVADGSRIHTQLLVDALRRDPELAVLPFETGVATLLAAVQTHNADVLLMNSMLDERPGRGFELLREIRSSLPKIRAVMLLDSSADDDVLSAFRAGARGVVSRNESVQTLNLCIRRVHEGQVWANHRQVTIAIEALAAAPDVRALNAQGMSLLSKRELQIVRSLAEGLTNREIAERLKLSQHTVKNYLFRVFDKLGVSSRVELLFMTLGGAVVEPERKKSKPSEALSPADEFGQFLQSAESGLPLPQLALTQMYASLQKEPRDVVQAYAWYLLAVDGGTQIKAQMEKGMTAKQIEEAHGRVKSWLVRLHSLGTIRHVGAIPQTPPAAKPPRPVEGLTQPSPRRENEKAKAASQL
jgi:DNA-binding NarL/FixJ family response regulator